MDPDDDANPYTPDPLDDPATTPPTPEDVTAEPPTEGITPEDHPISLLFAPKDNPALLNSGYAKTTQYVVPYLVDAGYHVTLHCPVGHDSNIMDWNHQDTHYEILGGGNGPYGESIVPQHLQYVQQQSEQPPVYFFLGDLQGLNHIPGWMQNRELTGIAWGACDWNTPTPNQFLERWNSFYRTFPLSHHGYDVLHEDGVQNLMEPVWLGCNTDLWRPIPQHELGATMNSIGFTQEGFNIAWVGANQFQRKGEYEMFQAVGQFAKDHPSIDVNMFCLTQVQRDWDLNALIQHLGLQDIVTLSSDYAFNLGEYTEQDVMGIVNAADVVMMLGFEGFGLPTIEAQATNTPVIGFREGATPELHQNGILVPAAKDVMYPDMRRKPLPDEEKAYEALRIIHDAKDDDSKFNSGRGWVEENATWAHTAEALLTRLASIEEDLIRDERLGPLPPGPKARERESHTLEVRA